MHQAFKISFADLNNWITLVTSIKHFNTLPKSKTRVFVCVVTFFYAATFDAVAAS